jgi:cell division protein FtsW
MFIFVAIVIFQNDYATSMILLGLGLLLFFLSGVSLKWFGVFFVFSVPIAIIFIFLEEYRVDRLIAFLKPEYDVKGINYQVMASKIAVSAGGFWGQGMGTGLEKIKSIPEVHADFVFSGWAEAMGFLGILGYFALLGYFSYKVFYIAAKCEDFFRSLLAFGCGTIIIIQSLLNCGVVCGALPSTGIPLPFFSHGGSSMLLTLVMCGVLINISRYENVSEMIYE